MQGKPQRGTTMRETILTSTAMPEKWTRCDNLQVIKADYVYIKN